MRRTVSLILTMSFVVTAVTGLLMMFAGLHMLTPVHELMSLILVIASVFHIVLNAGCIGKYIKENPILAGSVVVLTIAITMLIIFHSPHQKHRRGQHGPPPYAERFDD